MKKLFSFLALATMIGCATIDQSADPLVVRAEQVETAALSTFDLVLNIDNSNRPFFKANIPQFHEFAEWLREPVPPDQWPRATAMIKSLHQIKVAYKTNHDQGALTQSISTIEMAMSQASTWMASVTNKPAK